MSSYKKCTSWPTVAPDDNGIRPAGRSDECFYCHQKIGQPHGEECPCVLSLTLWNVLLDGVKVGTMEDYKVYGHELHTWEFHLNDSSWCADNCWGQVKWDSGKVPQELLDLKESECSCDLLSFEFVEVLDRGPFVSPGRNEKKEAVGG